MVLAPNLTDWKGFLRPLLRSSGGITADKERLPQEYGRFAVGCNDTFVTIASGQWLCCGRVPGVDGTGLE